MSPSELSQVRAEKLIDDLSDWIDQDNIARNIVESIEEECGRSAKMHLCQEVWLRFLATMRTDFDSISRSLSHDLDYDDPTTDI